MFPVLNHAASNKNGDHIRDSLLTDCAFYTHALQTLCFSHIIYVFAIYVSPVPHTGSTEWATNECLLNFLLVRHGNEQRKSALKVVIQINTNTVVEDRNELRYREERMNTHEGEKHYPPSPIAVCFDKDALLLNFTLQQELSERLGILKGRERKCFLSQT